MGFDFDIHYKEGPSNKALSRKQGAESLPMLLDNAHQDMFSLILKLWPYTAETDF